MSTEIKTITGRYEGDSYYSGEGMMVKYEPVNISLTRFMGGKKGAMVQLTLDRNNYAQLTKKQALELAETLKDAFDYDKYPSE